MGFLFGEDEEPRHKKRHATQLELMEFRVWEILGIVRKLEKKLASLTTPEPVFYTIIEGQKQRIKNMKLQVIQKLPVSVSFQDKLGNAAAVDGLPSWALTDESLAKLEIAADGMSAMVIPLGPVGSFKVQVSADADLGEGVKSILGELDIDLLPAEAVVVQIVAGEPQDI